MTGYVRSTRLRFSRTLLLLALLQSLVSQLSLTINATKFQQHEELELQRSMAKYRHLLKHESMRDVLQADDEQPMDESQGDLTETVAGSNSQQEEKVQTEEKVEEKLEEKVEAKEEEKVEEKEEESFIFPEPYLLGPPVKDWDRQRGRWLDRNPQFKTTKDGKPRVLVVTGSQPWPCHSPTGDSFHLKSLKLKIDYARMHNYQIYYNFVWLDPLFGSYWVKLPVVRKLMLTHPEIEWFLWIDSDAVFTDLLFEAPLESFQGTNMVMWGWKYGFYTQKNWIAMNAGVFFIRNCQWSLDLFDKWSPMGPEGPVRNAYGKMLTKYLSGRQDHYPADDQSALAYLVLSDEEVGKKVKIVEDEFKMSAWWVNVVDKFDMFVEKYHPGLGDDRWPWITHFTGCSPCGGGNNPDYSYEMCMENFERAYNFADNQVLAYLGWQHESLLSHEVYRTRNETVKPLEWLDFNPWAERMAQLAEATTSSHTSAS